MDIRTLKKQSPVRAASVKSPAGWRALLQKGKLEIRWSKGLSLQLKERFFAETGMLLSSGVDLQTILELSSGQENRHKKITSINRQLLQHITNGGNLADAMERTGQFSNFDCYSILIGENTGELAPVFEKLQHYYHKRIAQRRKMMSSLSYPVIILCTTAGAIYFMLSFIVPMFADTLKRFGGELPGITQFVISLSDHMGSWALMLFLLSVTAAVLYTGNRDNELMKKHVSSVLLRMPIFGKMIRKSQLAQFAQAMDLLLSARVSLVESLQITERMMDFYPLTTALKQVREDITAGSFFYAALERQSFFERTMITLVKIGEEVNQVDAIFHQLSKQYESELEYQSGLLMTILEPVMILFLALVVGFILISMYLPMFKLGTVIH